METWLMVVYYIMRHSHCLLQLTLQRPSKQNGFIGFSTQAIFGLDKIRNKQEQLCDSEDRAS